MKIITKIVKVYKKIRGLLPSALPTGATAFNAWADDIQDTYWLPTSDTDSVRYTLATIIMHLNQSSAFKSKWYFVQTLRASAAKQVAGNAFYEIKTRQQAAQAALTAAVTATPAVTEDAPQI